MTAKRSALIVATSEYSDGRLPKLEGPGHDAEALQTVLANAEIGGFEVELALNTQVDPLRRAIESFFADRARDDLLLVHFSGHGLKDDDGQLYLAAADTQLDRLASTGVDASWVNRLMNRCRSEKIALFLDCCFAGAFTAGMTRRAAGDTAGVKEQFTGSGLFVITASDAMQYSFEGGQQVGEPPEPSPFTSALVQGLKTGEADRNEDGVVSINELFDYLEDRVRETSPSQTPTKSAFNQVGDWAIARSTRVPSIRLLSEQLQKLLKSEEALDRFGALIELRDILEGRDSRLAEAATQALQRLSEDDSRRVAAAAERILAEAGAKPRSGAPAPIEAPEPFTPPEPAAPEPVAVAPIVEPPPPVAPVAASAALNADTSGPAPDQAPAVATPAWPPPPITKSSEPVQPVAAAAARQSEALWQQPDAAPVSRGVAATAAAAPTIAPTSAPAAPTTNASAGAVPGVRWSATRAVSRAALGIFLGVMFQFFWLLTANPWIMESTDTMDVAVKDFSDILVDLLVFGTIAVAVIEKFVPAFRVPDGDVYRVVGKNRWAAAAILGAGVGLTVGIFAEYYTLGTNFGSLGGLGLEVAVCTALGFVLAEAVVGRRFGGNKERSATA